MAPKAKKAAKKKTAKKDPVEIVSIDARYDFTDEEKLELGQRLTSQFASVASLEETAKASAADWKSRIKTAKATLNETHGKLSNGFEYRQTECELHFDWDKGRKFYLRKSDGKQVREESVTVDDRQTKLFREDQAKKSKEPKNGEPIVSVEEAYRKAEEPSSESE